MPNGMERVCDRIQTSQEEYYSAKKYMWDPLMPRDGKMTAEDVIRLKDQIRVRYEDILRPLEVSFLDVNRHIKHGMPLNASLHFLHDGFCFCVAIGG